MLTYAKIFFMDCLVGSPIDILELGPFRPGAEGSRIGSTLVWIPGDRAASVNNEATESSILPAGSPFYDSPRACEIRQIEYHALGERYLRSGVVFWPMRQTTDQGCPEKIWQLFPVNAARPLQ